ncbi:MAG: ABC transporter substrate-binding protein, partial [Eubacterium sp.]
MKKLKKLVVAVTLLALAVTGLSGCKSDDKNSGTSGTLNIGVTSFADTLEPTEQYFSWVIMRYGIGETLVKFNNEMGAEPWLAESWTLGSDNLTWTLKIREGVKFSNGTPLTAELVKASLERTFQMNKRAGSDFFQYDTLTVEGSNLMIKTKTPTPGLPGCLADPLFLIVDTTVDTTKFAAEGPICTGPYAVKSFDKEKCVVARNEHYWDGEVPYNEVNLQVIDDANTRAMALQSGEVDMAVNISSSDLTFFDGNDQFDINRIA